MLVLFVKLQKL